MAAVTLDVLAGLLAALGETADAGGYLVVSRAAPPESLATVAGRVNWRAVSGAADLDGLPRHPFAVVVDQLEHLGHDDTVHLLAALRDRYAERVLVCLVCDRDPVLSRSEFLALGYIEVDSPAADLRAFVHDPDEFFASREWNNPRHWANPENYAKFRW